MRTLVSVICLSVLFLNVAAAGPLVLGDVAQGAKWFGHVNFEGVRSMAIVQEMREKWDQSGRLEERMQWVVDKIGINPMEDLLGLTFYSTQYEGDVGVGLLYVKQLDREKMLAAFSEKHPDHTTSEHRGRTLYTWTVKKRGRQIALTGTIASDTLIVIGAGSDHVRLALDVVDGAQPGLGPDAPLVQGATANALFVARAMDVPADFQAMTKCPVLRRCQQAFVRWTEQNGEITADVEVTTASPEVAESFKAILGMAMAMGGMRLKKMESLQKLMDGLEFDTEGPVFWLSWKASIDDIRAAAQDLMSGRRGMRGQRPERGHRPGRRHF